MSFITKLVETRWVIPVTLGLYAFCGALLVAQKPGLHYDEALLVEGAVQLHHSAFLGGAEIPLAHSPFTWFCVRRHCLPLMGEGPYIGAVKDYLCLPLFALFGPTASAARLASMLLAMIGIWGIAKLVAQQVSPGAGAAVALILAVHPAYLNMTVFDNGVVAPMMAGLGLVCAALAKYLTRATLAGAFAIGAAAGFAVWARANFIWTLVAGGIAALLVYRKHLLIPAAHWLAIAGGGIAGGFPFLYYQVVSRGGTLQTMQEYARQASLATLFPLRVFWLADTLLSDGEHRVMWAATPPEMVQLPQWQLWLFPLVVLTASAICLVTMFERNRDCWRPAQFTTIALVLLGGFLFSSHLPITEHHLIATVPLAVVVTVLTCAMLQRSLRWGWMISAALALIYMASAGYWQIQSIQGLHRTGGTGVWSGAMVDLAQYLDRQYRGREIKILDWGFQSNLFVLMDGRLKSTEIVQEDSDARSFRGRPWLDEIREGGVFLLPGTKDRTFAAPVQNFLETWAAAQPATRVHRIAQQNGSTYAEILEIEPNTIRDHSSRDHSGRDHSGEQAQHHTSISMNDPALDGLSTGLYELQPDGWRWTKPEFSVTLDGPVLPDNPVTLSVHVFVPPQSIEKLGAITLSASIDGHAFQPETYREQGQYTFVRPVPADWLRPGPNRFDFRVDKHLGVSPEYPKELGIVVTAAALTEQ